MNDLTSANQPNGSTKSAQAAKFPVVCRTVAEVRQWTSEVRRDGKSIGFVPTMGALHAGHLSLVHASRGRCDCTVVSIYVNPSQFGPSEDFARYPRTWDSDLEQLIGLADMVFAPTDAEMYPPGFATWVEPFGVAEPLEGRHRPGHFRGVATVVLKLFHIVAPDIAFFGEKDFQQVRVIEQMRDDLHLPIEICRCPIVRELDGLAMSSRNRYLSEVGRRKAVVLFRALQKASQMVAAGERSATIVEQAVRDMIESVEDAKIDYVALVDPQTLRPVETIESTTLCALAVRIENTRLIDNTMLQPPN